MPDMFLAPPKLRKGDIIMIIAPARSFSVEDAAPAIALLESWGLHVKLGASIGPVYHQFAGSDELRAADLQAALDDDSVSAILCARGGYGTVRLLDRLDFTAFRKHPKWLIGFSDITYLHQHINLVIGVQSIHAPMAMQFAKASDRVLESLREALFEGRTSMHLPVHPLNRPGKAEGVLCGGNLSVLYSLTGTRTVINTRDKILFLEDLDEYLYHVERMMFNLKHAGKLEHLSALLCGGFTDMKDHAIPFGMGAEEIVFNMVRDYNYPVVFGAHAGHVAENLSLILGKKMMITVDENSVTINQI